MTLPMRATYTICVDVTVEEGEYASDTGFLPQALAVVNYALTSLHSDEIQEVAPEVIHISGAYPKPRDK